MANFVLLIAVLFATASFVSYTAAGYGQNWASDVCYAMPLACQSPQQMAYVAAGLAGFWILLKFVSALRG
ncbi:MAG: hypothetical protein WB772_07140 [Xanthobacteraceae bacterium]|jgi:hypothetical protein